MNFTDFAAKEGCLLLKDDINYIRRIIYNTPKAQRKRVMLEYVAIWVNAMAQCDNAVKQQNEGRKAANIWLRKQRCIPEL